MFRGTVFVPRSRADRRIAATSPAALTVGGKTSGARVSVVVTKESGASVADVKGELCRRSGGDALRTVLLELRQADRAHKLGVARGDGGSSDGGRASVGCFC